jgi:hypothetical protein
MANNHLYDLRITEQTYRSFVNECASSVSTNLWICGRCGVGSFGLERANSVHDASSTRSSNWRTVSRTDTSTRYLTVNPHVEQFAVPPDQPQRVCVCTTCANEENRHKAAHVPVVPSNMYNAALAESTFDDLQHLSILQPQYKIVHEAYGYVKGAWADTACIDALLLSHVPISRNVTQAVDTFLQILSATNPLYTIFRPVLHQLENLLTELPPEAWAHIERRQRRRDPVANTPDTESNLTHSMAILQGLAGPPSQDASRVHAGTLFTVTGERFVADLAPSGLLHTFPHDMLERPGVGSLRLGPGCDALPGGRDRRSLPWHRARESCAIAEHVGGPGRAPRTCFGRPRRLTFAGSPDLGPSAPHRGRPTRRR